MHVFANLLDFEIYIKNIRKAKNRSSISNMYTIYIFIIINIVNTKIFLKTCFQKLTKIFHWFYWYKHNENNENKDLF